MNDFQAKQYALAVQAVHEGYVTLIHTVTYNWVTKYTGSTFKNGVLQEEHIPDFDPTNYDKIFNQGRDAYLSWDGCPYKYGTQEYIWWYKGWNFQAKIAIFGDDVEE